MIAFFKKHKVLGIILLAILVFIVGAYHFYGLAVLWPQQVARENERIRVREHYFEKN